jgi:quercetin dioxygenase-like cupin family protein
MLFPRSLQTGLALFAALAGCGAVSAEEAKIEEAKMPPRQVLLDKPVELPANKLVTRVVRVVFPPGYKTPLHTHEGPGPRYVVKGKVKVEEGGQVHEYGPGEVFWETGQWIAIENIGQGEAEVVAVELAAAAK